MFEEIFMMKSAASGRPFWKALTFLAVACATALLSAPEARADVDCTRPVSRVWSGNNGYQIYVMFSDGKSPAGMMLADAANDQAVINRTLSVILAGHVSGRPVTLRYTVGSDGSVATCAPAVLQRFSGAWIN